MNQKIRLMMKLTIILLLCFFSAQARNKHMSKCELLQVAIESNFFEDHFNLCENLNDTITLFAKDSDLNCFFIICKRPIKMEHRITFNITYRGLQPETKNKIIVTECIEKKKTWLIGFFEPYTNEDLVLKIHKKKPHYIELLSMGEF